MHYSESKVSVESSLKTFSGGIYIVESRFFLVSSLDLYYVICLSFFMAGSVLIPGYLALVPSFCSMRESVTNSSRFLC